MNFYPKPIKLHDCETHGATSAAELFIVEGDSASTAIAAIRDRSFQAVLPMQGKPLNAHKASLKAVQNYELYRELLLALGFPELCTTSEIVRSSTVPEECRFSKIILLFDPDADGIHCGALLQIFFLRMLRPLVESGMLTLIRAPLYRFRVTTDPPKNLFAYMDDQARKIARDLDQEGFDYQRQRFRGLAGIDRDLLLQLCINPDSRSLEPVTIPHCEAALAVFGGS
ncbi:MAG: toprim domain-containing protein [Planctomycetota bacterium]